jgi:acyl-CoA synthetase (AMP-forming)/AMP-acid ligase II
MVSHRNIIANMMQFRVFEQPGRKKFGVETQVGFAVLPLSHVYGLHVVALSQTWRGDELIVMPKFDLTTYLKAIERFKVECLTIVSGSVTRAPCTSYDRSVD